MCWQAELAHLSSAVWTRRPWAYCWVQRDAVPEATARDCRRYQPLICPCNKQGHGCFGGAWWSYSGDEHLEWLLAAVMRTNLVWKQMPDRIVLMHSLQAAL
ncbi:hypothetical protein WJX74_000602 [Apatococcus lobatus]|uniref:Uncharacterized protein n=1 Tax=Apatococcus lobatus TaxID=904363 RepID=A0AAW1QI55_9CHLO